MAPNTKVDSVTQMPKEQSIKKIIPDDPAELKAKVLNIRRAIRNEEKLAMQKYPFLKHQDLIGLLIFSGSLAVSVGTGICYWQGYISAFPAVMLIGFFVGILHELEHDLIHDLYFKNHVWLQDFMFLCIWISKLNVNPWYRRVVHLRHHARSGQHDDIEERLIGLGLPFSWLRMMIVVNPLFALLLSRQIKKDAPSFSVVEALATSFPVTTPLLVLSVILYIQLVGLFPVLISADPAWYEFCWKLNVVINIPNILRQGSLVLMSSYCHYYEDLPEGGDGLFFQNQILNTPFLWPFQLFCFNFGSTHIIHHYVTNQPFYLRQIIAKGCHKAMLDEGVRHNDYGVVARANRFSRDAPSQGWFKKVWTA